MSQPPPKVSVIIPVYNRPGDVRTAIASVLAQTEQDFEIIVVDDCSTDDGKTVLAAEDCIAQHSQKIRLIRHDVNKGVGGARNTGIAAAAGEYIALLDSDDEWHQHKLERQLSKLSSQHDKMTICLCDYLSIPKDEDGKTVTIRPSLRDNLESSMLFGHLYNIGTCVLAHRSVFDPPYRFDESFVTVAEDYDWLVRHLLRGGKCIAVNEVLATYRAEPKKLYKNHVPYLHRLYKLHSGNVHKALGLNGIRYFLGGINKHLLYVARQKNKHALHLYYFMMMAIIPPDFLKRIAFYIGNRMPFKKTTP